jgi:hypothetical protein
MRKSAAGFEVPERRRRRLSVCVENAAAIQPEHGYKRDRRDPPPSTHEWPPISLPDQGRLDMSIRQMK